MVGNRLRSIAIVTAGFLVGGAAHAAADAVAQAADDTGKPQTAPRGFYQRFLAPRISSRLNGEIAAAVEFTNPAANPWTRDERTIGRIEHSTLKATKDAFKHFAIEGFALNAWSLPVSGAGGTGLGAFRSDSGGTRLRFGVSHLAPRADVLIPSSRGSVTCSADLRGRLGASFKAPASKFSVGLTYSVPERAGVFALGRRF